jgi:hypothetical protein
MRQHAARDGRWQTPLTVAGMIGAINSVVLGVMATLPTPSVQKLPFS